MKSTSIMAIFIAILFSGSIALADEEGDKEGKQVFESIEEEYSSGNSDYDHDDYNEVLYEIDNEEREREEE